MTLPNLSASQATATTDRARGFTEDAVAFPRRDIVDALERLLDLGELEEIQHRADAAASTAAAAAAADATTDSGNGKLNISGGEAAAPSVLSAAAMAASAAQTAALSAASAEVALLQQRLEQSTEHEQQLRERVERSLDDKQRRALSKVCAVRMSSIDAALEGFKQQQHAVLTQHGGKNEKESVHSRSTAGTARAQAASALLLAPGTSGLLSHRIGSRVQRCLSLEKAVISAEARASLQATVLKTGSLCAVHRPKRALLPAAAKDVLNRWLREHADAPFPTDVDKLSLAAEGGISKEQVSVWFTNARARAKTRERKAMLQSASMAAAHQHGRMLPSPPPPARPPPPSPDFQPV
jgi:hypothetical protein